MEGYVLIVLDFVLQVLEAIERFQVIDQSNKFGI